MKGLVRLALIVITLAVASIAGRARLTNYLTAHPPNVAVNRTPADSYCAISHHATLKEWHAAQMGGRK